MAAASFLCLAALGLAARPGAGEPAQGDSWDYSNIISSRRDAGISFSDLPGFTRSVYARDHALITPESRVWAGQAGWEKAVTAHLISPANGATFAMFLADISAGGSAGSPPAGVERFVFVLDGALNLTTSSGSLEAELFPDHYAFLPAGSKHRLATASGAGLVVYERVAPGQGKPQLQHGATAAQPLLPVPGEVFALRKLLPQSPDYSFNIHVMDFKPGEHLNVKEIHYNQHGLLLLQGKGIYRLADSWYPVQAGDAIWMPPYVIQWYAALGTESSRYILFKDTSEDPVLFGQRRQ